MGISAVHPLSNGEYHRYTQRFSFCFIHLFGYFLDLHGHQGEKGNRAGFFNFDTILPLDLYLLGIPPHDADIFPARGKQPRSSFSARRDISFNRGTSFSRRVEGENEVQELNLLYAILVFLLYIPVQTSLLSMFQIGGIQPDIAFVLVYFLGWNRGLFHGIFWGFALGGMADISSIGVLGVNCLTKIISGLAGSLSDRSFLNPARWVNVLIVFGLSVICDFVGHFFMYDWEADPIGPIGFASLLARGCSNGLFTYLLFRFLPDSLLKPRRQRIPAGKEWAGSFR